MNVFVPLGIKVYEAYIYETETHFITLFCHSYLSCFFFLSRQKGTWRECMLVKGTFLTSYSHKEGARQLDAFLSGKQRLIELKSTTLSALKDRNSTATKNKQTKKHIFFSEISSYVVISSVLASHYICCSLVTASSPVLRYCIRIVLLLF